MRKFVIMAVANRLYHCCDSKRCMRMGWLDRWYDYMFAVNGPERLREHGKVLIRYYAELYAGRPGLLDLSKLEL